MYSKYLEEKTYPPTLNSASGLLANSSGVFQARL